jgi:streptogramin lyase
MSDLLTELRREVVGAHAKHQRRSVRATRARRWRPVLAGAAALAAAVVAIVIAARSLPAPEPSGEPRVVEVLRIGGIPVDGVLADGALWVTDAARDQVVRIDPAARKVVARVQLDDTPDEIAAGDGGLWVRGPIGSGTGPGTALWRIDPATNRVVARTQVRNGYDLAVGAGAVWTTRRLAQVESIDRLDPRRGTPTRRVPLGGANGVAVAGRWAWAVAQDGTIVRIDTRSGRARRWPRLARPGAEDASEALVADGAGVWVLSAGEGRIRRVEGGSVTRVIRVSESTLPIMARAADGLWIVEGDDRRGYRVARIGVRTGITNATVELGARRPRALVPVKRGLWVISGDGTAVLIKT